MNAAWPSVGLLSPNAVDRLLDSLSQLRITIREKYLSRRATTGERYSVTLRDYMTHEDWAKEKRLVCPEDYSQDLQDLASEAVSHGELGLDDVSNNRVSIHAAYGGSVTPLHFDWDHSRVHHLCLVGRRALWLRPPRPGRLLPSAANSVLADFEEMPADQREQILTYFGAKRFVLEPGEYVQFPSCWWHLVEYLEVSAAVSFRKELSPLLRPATVLPRSVEVQYIIGRLASAPEQSKVTVIASLVSGFIESLREGDASFTAYSSAIRHVEKELGLIPMSSDPWIAGIGMRPEINLTYQFRTAMEKVSTRAEEVSVCRDWLFGHWPTAAAPPSETASLLASFMACAMSHS